MNAIFKFFTQLDKQALRAITVLVVMILLVILMIIYGKTHLNFSEGSFFDNLEVARGTPWALPLVIVIFTLAAFVGAPQWMLIAASVLTFGALQGAIYAWVATMVSASIDFSLGRYLGADRLRRFGGALINRISAMVRSYGFFTSFGVRFVPTGPFVLVNMAAGVSHMRFWAFFAGTGLGIVPKILAIAFFGQSISQAVSSHIGVQNMRFILTTLVLAGFMIAVMLFARSRLGKRVAHENDDAPLKES